MTDLNLDQVQTRLNELFVTYGERKLIFWYDPDKEFEEDIDNDAIKLDNAKIYKLDPKSQFKTKRLFEIEDTKNNYLIYSPFNAMDENDENNHLLSILKYSTQFKADKISIIMTQLNIPVELHDAVKRYSKFFEAKSRIVALEKIAIAGINTEQELEFALMAVLTKAKTNQFYSIVQALFVDYSEGSTELYEQLKKYNLQESFWKYISVYYGYLAETPTIQKLVIAFFANGFYGQLDQQELPVSLKEYEVLNQTTAIVSFMDEMMNDIRYVGAFNKLSHEIYKLINGEQLLNEISVDELLKVDIFEAVHNRIIMYVIGQLLSGDKTPSVGNIQLFEIVKDRQRAHFGEKYKHQYAALLSAQKLLWRELNINSQKFTEIVKVYEDSAYKSDRDYRNFIWNYKKITEKKSFAELQLMVEKKYKAFLDEVIQLWNDNFEINERTSILDFYDHFIRNKQKTVVIISDDLRDEVAKELQAEFQDEKKLQTEMKSLFSVLPSVTEFGKAALLRGGNEKCEYIDGIDVRIDGEKTQGTIARDKILKKKNPNSLAITYSDVVAKTSAKELRDIFNGQEVIYLYHDQIDKVGDHGQEMQVFDATQRAVTEIKEVLKFIYNGANVYRFIITSDHGFIYTDGKVSEYEKIENPSVLSTDRVERRFIISEEKYDELGIESIELGKVLRNDDKRHVYFPKTSAIFKKAGGGQRYVHGGSSPQELIVPALEVNVMRGSSQKEPVDVKLMTSRRRINGLAITLEFYQTEKISDSISKAAYSVYFEDANGNLITNKTSYYADSKAEASSERFTKFTFDFINRSYEINEKVYLILKDLDTNVEKERVEFSVDNPFAGVFGFDI